MNEYTVLIADDALFMRKMIRNTLTEDGFENFVEAANGTEAIERFAEGGIDLVFLDVTMPDRDGLEALREIMSIDAAAKVVMCSAIGQDATIMEALRAGASEFIVKPFKKDHLIEIAHSLVG